MFKCDIGSAETQVDKLVYTEKLNYYKDFFQGKLYSGNTPTH